MTCRDGTCSTGKMDNATLDFILAFEQGEVASEEELIAGFQNLVNTGLVWSLQGTYGRIAKRLIEEGLVFLPLPDGY